MTDDTCSVDGCAKPVQAVGLCPSHYGKHRRAGKTCSLDSCERRLWARGWCEPHYLRWKEHGDPLGGTPLRPLNGSGRSFVEAAASYQGDDCLVWPFGKNDAGYPQVYIDGRTVYAHRYVLELVAGPPFPGAVAAHAPIVCHNPSCVNPRHLRWATVTENLLDTLIDGTHASLRAAG